jgi:hypothetical protein
MKAIVGIILAALIIGMTIAMMPVRAQPNPDINGDGVVDMKDIGEAAKAYGATPQHPRWDGKCDMNGDGIINMKDLVYIASHFGT